MREQKESNNKIGARCLSELEAELILPTYKRIYDQIDRFRMEKNSIDRYKKQGVDSQNGNQDSRNQDKTQKTNNIGIIGVRGAGKTSVLKTIRVRLETDKCNEEQKPNDIILPIIVPENMSESGTLMATILGMLSEVVKEREEEEKKAKKRYNGDCIQKTSLRLKYDEVVKQYTYIQKEYRDILIRQYTTENDYVNRSAKVFNSDTEFINRFNELIDELVNAGNPGGSSSLLFLFIDDIDLSTYQCADVVRTLLSYLSNENIVTFISGDLETFEEALTLDFLRRENVLDKDILKEEVGNNTLLASKKMLAYEYLKKIIPPAYRYNIKYWSLEEMGKYCIGDSPENQAKEDGHTKEQEAGRQRAGITLSDLLPQALDGWVAPSFFCYAEIEEDEKKDIENRSQEEKEDKNEKHQVMRKVLPYTYHLFDNTSRGLNNIYNVLGEIVAARKNQKTDYSKEKKLLLDTIISSKPIYNKYRNDIQQNFFYVGMTKDDSRVFFDNAKAVIYRKGIEEIYVDNPKKQENYPEMIYYIEDPVERFSLFILVDFAARLLFEQDYERQVKADASYKLLKDEAMKDLFFHPIIAEKVMDVSDYCWESKEEIRLKRDALKNNPSKEENYPALKDMKLKHVNSSFLLKGDLMLNLAYYKNLPLDEILKLYENKASEKLGQELFDAAELEQSVIIAIWRAFSSIARVNAKGDVTKIIARYYPVFWKEFAYIRNQMSSSVTQNIAIRLFDDEINAVLGKSKSNAEQERQDARKEKAQMRRILSNTLACVLKAQDGDVIQEEWQEMHSDKPCIILNGEEEIELEEGDEDRKDIERRVQILKVIDSNKLWQEEAAENVVGYLKKTVRAYLKFMKEAMEGKEWGLNTSAAQDSWDKFEEMYAGETRTIARRTRSTVRKILKDNQIDNFHQRMSFETYGKVIKELEGLAGNNLVWYGQSEAQQILNDLQEASADPNNGGDWDTWMEAHSYFKILLQCLYKYKMVAEENNNINKNASMLAHIREKLSIAHKDADKETLKDFTAKLNEDLEEKIGFGDFEKLFLYS